MSLRQRWHRLLRRVARGARPDPRAVMLHGRQDAAEAVRAIASRVQAALAAAPGRVFSLGDGDAFHADLNRELVRRRIAYRAGTLADLLASAPDGFAAIACGYADARRRTAAARALAADARWSPLPLLYALGLNREAALFDRRDEYAEAFFVSPVLLDEPSPYDLYEESLAHFEQKCGLRDYLDLYQLLKDVIRRGVPGDVAEFGSYQGHSGWLLARTLQAFGDDRRVFLFDTFEAFPQEPLGLDRFWSGTHAVSFDAVRARFRDLPNVQFVQGDFTTTLAGSGLGAVALAHVDCDSYRATRFVLEALLDRHLPAGGTLVCEDYGHPALLAHRTAVHEVLERDAGLFRFFSQFSGMYVAVRMRSAP